tara:strand:- start:38 stop:886 length:849 start_codon:yes stop_codon:yes gene_type:complete
MANTKIPVELSSTPSIVDGGNATAITIDSSENVLVGQTLASSNAVGTSLRQDGRNFYCADGNYSAHFNRKTSDGAIVHFAKDDTIVGSIGVDFNTEFYMGGGGGGFYINTASIRPTTGGDASTLSDNTHDLGASSTRFKDIYLSGGVNFGATGGAVSSKTLDDYEEGTWTPAISGASGGTALGYYTKIGNLVFIKMRISWTSMSSTTSTISGLPVASNSATQSMAMSIYSNSGFGSIPSGKGYLNAYVDASATTMYCSWQPNTTQANFAASGNIYISGTYTT